MEVDSLTPTYGPNTTADLDLAMSGHAHPAHDRDLVTATLEESRRVLQIQREELESLYRRTDGLIRVSIASLAAVIATSGILAGLKIHIPWRSAALIGAGTMSVLVSTTMFVSTLVGYPRAVVQWVGPDLDHLTNRLHDEGWNLGSMHESLLLVFRDGARDNTELQDRFITRLGHGVTGLIFGTTSSWQDSLLYSEGAFLFDMPEEEDDKGKVPYHKQIVRVRDLGRTGITKGAWRHPRKIKDKYRLGRSS